MKRLWKQVCSLALIGTMIFQPCLVHAEEAVTAEESAVTEEMMETEDVNDSDEGIVAEDVAVTDMDQDIEEAEVVEIVEEETTREPQAAAPTITYSPYASYPNTLTVSANSNNTFLCEYSRFTRHGYEFLGWSTNSAATTPMYLPGNTYSITSNMTLYGVWKDPVSISPDVIQAIYTANVTYKGMYYYFKFVPRKDGYYHIKGASAYLEDFVLYENNTVLILSNGDTRNVHADEFVRLAGGKTYYIRMCFSDNANVSSGTLRVLVERVRYLEYDRCGGTDGPSPQYYVEGQEPNGEDFTVSSVIPTRKGYEFLGWGGDLAGSYLFYPGDTINVYDYRKVFAQWGTPAQISCTSASSYSANVNYGGQERLYRFTPATRGYYQFESAGSDDTKIAIYNEAGSLLNSDDDSGQNQNFLLTQWLESGTTCYVGVKYYNAKKVGTLNFSVKRAYPVTYYGCGGTNVPDTQYKVPGQSLFISTQIPKREMSVRFNANGGSCSLVSKIYTSTFEEWNTDEVGIGRSFGAGATYTENADMRLYAMWDDPVYGTLPTPTRSGYTFDGWYLGASGTTKVTSSMRVRADCTLYAHWTANTTEMKITQHPKNVTVGLNGTATFKVVAQGSNLTYQWQYSKNGGEKWLNSSATTAKTDSISVKVSASNAGNIYRCKVSGSGKTIYSNTAGVDLIPGAVINLNPQSQVAAIGEYAIFTIDAENAAGYQWQYSKDGAHWYSSGAEGNQTSTLKVKGAQNSQGNRYRCVVTGIDGNKKKSLAAAMIVLKTAPVNSNAAVGQTATFSLNAEGISEYMWQYSKDGGKTWYKSGAAGFDSNSVSFKVTSTNRTMIYRCKLSCPDGAYAYTKTVGFN